MKKVGIAAAVILILSLIGETIFLFQQFSVQQQLTGKQAELQQKISDLEKDKVKLEGSQANLQGKVESLERDKKALTDQVVRLEGDGQALRDQIADLDKTSKQKATAVSKSISEIASLKNKLYCKDSFSSVDFSSNEKVSEKLATYVKSTKSAEEPVSAHYWNLIWTGSKYSVHTVEVYSQKDKIVYLWKFTVYFKGEAHGDHVNGIFYNDGQCWLYLEK